MAYQASELGSDNFELALDATILTQIREKIRSTSQELRVGEVDELDKLEKECLIWEEVWIKGNVGEVLGSLLSRSAGIGYKIVRSQAVGEECDPGRTASANRLLVFMAVMHSIKQSFSSESGLADDPSASIFDSRMVTIGFAKLAEARHIVGFDKSGALGVLEIAREELALPTTL